MNKNLKRIIAIALAVGGFSATAPATNFNLLTTKAYASNDDADDLDGIDLQDDDGDSVELYTDDGHDDEVDDDLEVGDTYYAEVTTGSEVKIDSITGPDDENVRIFVGSDEYEVGDSIPIDHDDGDITTLKVRVYEDDYDEDEDYDSSDYNEYQIKVEYTGDDDDDDDDDDENDEDTLDSLELQDENSDTIDLYTDSSYDDDVDSDEVDEGSTYYAKTSSDKVSIETSGLDDEYVRVFKSTDDSAEGIEIGDDISVSEDTTLTVRIYSEEPDDDIEYEDDDDVIGEYEIELEYTGNNSSSSTSGTITATSTPDTATTVSTASTVKSNQWVQVNGGWQYNDTLGQPLKNQWFLERNYGKWYYLGVNGMMATNSWILTGGKYYYVGGDGAMATNTTISGYKVAADGAWVQ